MKRVFTVLAILFCPLMSIAQNVSGFITVGKSSEMKINLKSDNIIDLFSDFHKGVYPIIFSFKVDNLKNKEGREIILFDFSTEVYFNGKLLGKATRTPNPYLPGEILIGPESFDFISLLTYNEMTKTSLQETPGKLPSGRYQVKIGAKPVEFKGQIRPGIFSFIII